MDLVCEESDALLLPVATADRAVYKHLSDEDEEKQGEARAESKKRRRRVRLHRMDVACLAVVGLVACIITVRQPALRTENPLLLQAATKAPAPVALGFVSYADLDVAKNHRAYEAAYEPRSFTVDGRATLLLGTVFPYARAAPETWESLLLQTKRDGNNVVAIDVSWEQHESTRGVFNLAGSANLTRVYELAARVGVFVHVRFHPRGCTQPVDAAGASVQAWQAEVERFVTVMVAVSRPFLASNGGPIITMEMFNGECSSTEGVAQWTGDLTSLLNTSTPWITEGVGMQSNALVQCTDAHDCEQFVIDQTKRGQLLPLLWTRPRSDGGQSASQLAYRVSRWFAVGGAAYIDHTLTEMLDQAMDNETDSRRQATDFHLSKLRHVLHQCSGVLASSSPAVEAVDYSSLRPQWQRALVFGTRPSDQVVFLENADDKTARVAFHGAFYDLPAKSVVVLRSNAVVFNTSDVHAAVNDHGDATDGGGSIVATGR